MKKTTTLLFAVLLSLYGFTQEEEIFNEEAADKMANVLEEMFASKAEMKDEYSYKGKVTMMTKEGDEEAVSLDIWLGDNGKDFGLNGMPGSKNMKGEVFVVFEGELQTMFMCMEQGGQKIAMSMGMPGQMPGMEKQTIEKIELEKGERQKEIMGYTCQEYILKSTYKTITYWITEEENEELSAVKDMIVTMELYNKAESITDYGVVLGFDEENSFSETKTVSTIEAYDQDVEMTFNSSEYELMNMKEMMELEKSKMEVPQD